MLANEWTCSPRDRSATFATEKRTARRGTVLVDFTFVRHAVAVAVGAEPVAEVAAISHAVVVAIQVRGEQRCCQNAASKTANCLSV